MKTYDGTPIRELVTENAPEAALPEFLVYVMGAYTAFDAERALATDVGPSPPYPPDALFDPHRHGSMHEALAELCATLRSEYSVRAFLATDVGIPTVTAADERDLDEPGMTPAEQSIAFARVSDAVVFLFPHAGLNAGVAAETGAVPEHFDLRVTTDARERKPPERFRIFRDAGFASATVEEFEYDYEIPSAEYASRAELVDLFGAFLRDVKRREGTREFPLYRTE